MIADIIRQGFDAEINNVFKEKHDIKKYILNHERKETCISNITREIKTIELKSAIRLDKARIETLAGDFARTFAKIALTHLEEQNKTELQKRIERKDHEENEFFEKLFSEELEEKDRSHGI